jgi:hypothetical protein
VLAGLVQQENWQTKGASLSRSSDGVGSLVRLNLIGSASSRVGEGKHRPYIRVPPGPFGVFFQEPIELRLRLQSGGLHVHSCHLTVAHRQTAIDEDCPCHPPICSKDKALHRINAWREMAVCHIKNRNIGL